MIQGLIQRFFLTFGSNKQKIKISRNLGVTIGENCCILGRAIWGSEPYLIKIGNHVKITSGVRFVTHDGGVYVLRNQLNNSEIDLFGPITIGNNVFVGIDTVIMPGVTVSDNVIIGAKSVVTKDLEANSVYAGNPARKICSLEEYYFKNKNSFDYTKGLNYREKKEVLTTKFFE